MSAMMNDSSPPPHHVLVPSQIKDLTDHHLPGKKHLVTCVAEGVPAPIIQWFSCDSMLKYVCCVTEVPRNRH